MFAVYLHNYWLVWNGSYWMGGEHLALSGLHCCIVIFLNCLILLFLGSNVYNFPESECWQPWSCSWLQRHTQIRFFTPRKADPKSLRLLCLSYFSLWKHVYLHVSSCLAWPNLCECECVRERERTRRLTTAELSQSETDTHCLFHSHTFLLPTSLAVLQGME